MIDRRRFLKQSALAGAAACCCPGKWAWAKSTTSAVGGVPDTLDLVEHGRMAINGVLGSLDPAFDYECTFLNILDVHPAYMVHWSSMVSGVMPKYIEALPMLRQMSGETKDLDLENGFLEAMQKNMDGDGLIYDRVGGRPWNVGVYYGKPDWNEDYANMAGNGRGIAGMTYQYQATGDESWKKRAKKTAERMLELAIVDGDYGWYPNPGLGNDFSYPRESGWTTTKPPEKAREGFEGATLFYLFQPLRGFARWYQLSGDERFLSLSRKFVNFGLQKKFWGNPSEANRSAGAERGHFHGHFHGTLAAQRGLLDYAIVANDAKVKHFVRDGYEWARQRGIARLGLASHDGAGTEGCAVGDMVGLAVALTDAGLGDYWDDVEMTARNGLLCAQATDLAELRRVSEAGPERPANVEWGGHYDTRFKDNKRNRGALPDQEIHDRVLERTIGAFGHVIGAQFLTPMMMHCCTANCAQALYYAWEGIVRRAGDTAQVNMWLNRRSPWLDVESHLPYAGKLVIHNKGMKRILVRKPAWARRRDLRCRINGVDAKPIWLGNRLRFIGLKGNETLTVETPVPLDKADYTLVNLNGAPGSKERYACEFKGHTAVGVKPLVLGEGNSYYVKGRDWYRLFRRDHLRAPAAPLKAGSDYVHPEKLVTWTVS